jgi:hypothetical protein
MDAAGRLVASRAGENPAAICSPHRPHPDDILSLHRSARAYAGLSMYIPTLTALGMPGNGANLETVNKSAQAQGSERCLQTGPSGRVAFMRLGLVGPARKA